MSAPLRYVDELKTVQDGLERTIAAIEKRLVGSRMARLAPLPRVEVGYRGVTTAGQTPKDKKTTLPEIPKPPSGLKDAVWVAVNDLESEAAAVPEEKTAEQENQDGQKNEIPVDVDPSELESLIHEKVVVGNRREINFIAGVRLRLPAEGRFGVKALFPRFETGPLISFEVEVTLHRVDRIDDFDEGLEIGPLVPAMLQNGWPFRVFPWNAATKRDIGGALMLPTSFTSVKENEEVLGAGGHLFGDDVFLILALDPESGERALAEEAAYSTPEEPEKQADEDVDQTTKHDSIEEEVSLTPSDAPAPSAQFERAYAAFVQSTNEAGDFPSFMARLKVFESELPETVEPWSAEFFDEFEKRCRRSGALREEAADPFEDTNFAARPADDIAYVDETPRLQPTFDRRQLIRKFKHAADFGVIDPFSPRSLERFAQTLEEHIADATGRYAARLGGVILVAHVRLGRIVWTTNEGEFVTGYKASPDQLKFIWSKPVWRKA